MDRVFQQTIAGTFEAYVALCRELAGFLDEHQISGSVRNTVDLAVEEMVTNVIRHAYEGSGGTVDVAVHLDDGLLRVCLADRGKPFDPTTDAPAPDFDSPLSERRVGGLGVALVRSLARELRYRREGDRNIVEVLIDRA